MDNFFTPYSFAGKISYFLFRNCFLFRKIYSVNNLESYFPENDIRQHIGKNAVVAYNCGTKGIEQKISALGLVGREQFFFKYAQTILARQNVRNEYKVLKQFSELDFTPKVLAYSENEKGVLLKTNVLEGLKLTKIKVDLDILKSIYQISQLSPNMKCVYKGDLKTTFAHGDFCPWNMLDNKGKLMVYDWEMAGEYPLGYDLFTFIFQTSFLLRPKLTVENIVEENRDSIMNFFNTYNITNWQDYLLDFAGLKMDLEKPKDSKGLYTQFKKLFDYAKKI